MSEKVGDIIRATPKTRFDRAHFLGFDESQLIFEVVHIVLTSHYNQHMDMQQVINLQLLDALRELDVRFALPRRDLRLVSERAPVLKVAGPSRQVEANHGEPDHRLQSAPFEKTAIASGDMEKTGAQDRHNRSKWRPDEGRKISICRGSASH